MGKAIWLLAIAVGIPALWFCAIGGGEEGSSSPAPFVLQAGYPAFAAAPGPVTVQSNDPDGVPAVIGSPVTLTFAIWLGPSNRQWRLYVSSGSASVTGCPRIPVSAFRIVCSAASASAGSASCGSAVQLSIAPQTIALGNQPGLYGNYSVTLRVEFSDSWSYPAAGCSLNLIYTVDAP